MFAKTFGGTLHGVDAQMIVIEVNVTQGQKFYISGLPDGAVKESQHRVESSLKSAKYHMPRTKVVVNLAPADIRKEGSAYDLPMALGILKASNQIMANQFAAYVIMGELSLDGMLRPIRGALSIAVQAKKEGFKGFILPVSNAREASIVEGLDVIGVNSLQEAIGFLADTTCIAPTTANTDQFFDQTSNHYENNFSDVQGQESIKRAMEIAAAGGHNVIMIGPPGAGKTMLAKRLPSILPPLTLREALETTKIHSVAGKTTLGEALLTTRPFRAPHHTISDVALVGGGGHPQPGEISLAHHGVLFLDELPEFKRTVLEVMRQPMEERNVTISRARISVDYPANFMLVASMNPCPCGNHNHPDKECVCSPGTVQRYLNRVSGPVLDRIDLHIEVAPVNFNKITAQNPSESSESIRKRVVAARNIQSHRLRSEPTVYNNAMMSARMTKEMCSVDDAGRMLLQKAMDRLGLSARAYDRILKVSRTIADLASSDEIQPPHLAEAIQYRGLDRAGWGM